jgi:Protein of unknown function (DUF4058)
MAIRLSKNPYRGINAHYNSYLQQPYGGWESFHHDYITYLKSAINRSLPEGYYALAEKSLQIRRDTDKPLSTRPDIGILKQPHTPPTSSISSFATPTLEVALEPTEEDLYSIVIYRRVRNKFITRIELLSPSNKASGDGYIEMRNKMVAYGVHMVEIDYLHQSPPLYSALPDYTQHLEKAYPYSITISNIESSLISFYCFHVDEAIPTLVLPLEAKDTFALDFNDPYHIAIEDDRRIYLDIDYEQVPANFASYAPTDQARIRAVMERISREG